VRLSAMAATLLLSATVFFAGASAQTPPAKKPPAADKKAAPADKKQATGAQTAWVKLCEKATAQVKGKDGKDEKKDLNICLTHHERLDGNTGMVLVSAALRQIDGQDKQHFMVMVPLGMLIQPGMRATVFPKNLWEKVQKNEKLEKTEEAKLKGLQLSYTLCHAAGCTADRLGQAGASELAQDARGRAPHRKPVDLVVAVADGPFADPALHGLTAYRSIPIAARTSLAARCPSAAPRSPGAERTSPSSPGGRWSAAARRPRRASRPT